MKALAIALALLPPAIAAASGISLKSLDLSVPDGAAMFPPGAGADAANGNCLACHSVEMVLTQPAMSKAGWGRRRSPRCAASTRRQSMPRTFRRSSTIS
jgi:mono/diheme cytochrome c family protein